MNALLAQASGYSYEQRIIAELRGDISVLKTLTWGLLIVILILAIIIFLQRVLIRGLKRQSGPDLDKGFFKKRTKPKVTAAEKEQPEKKNIPVTSGGNRIKPKDLPDPGLLFKFSLAAEHVLEKEIIIGQKEGNIKTYSTEIIDHHLSCMIRIIENRRDKDIYDLPDTIIEEYQLYLRREGKALIMFPEETTFREMATREKIQISPKPDDSGEPSFKTLDPKKPIRIRLGDRLNQDGKFVSGYFEFHIMTQDYPATTKAGIKKIEKNFFFRLFKIYPGYDTAAQNADDLFPMIDPYATGR